MQPNKASVKSTREVNSMFREPDKPLTFAVSTEHRHHMIAEAAYYMAEKRGFIGGSAVDDWLTAEIEINKQLMV